MSTRLLHDELPKARKAHRCIWCGEAIEAGEIYRRQRVIFDNQPQSNAWHTDCFDSVDHLDMDEGFSPYDNERPKRLPDNESAQRLEVPK